MAICYGLRKDVKRFWWCENTQSRTEIGITESPLGPLEDWMHDIGALAPFSLPGRRPDSHIALMAPLLEPIFNALKSLKDDQALSVHIVDRIPNAVEIHVANESDDPPLHMAPGLKQAQDLWSQTKLATIDLLPKGECCCTTVFENRAYACVRVRLHPDIIRSVDHSGEAESGQRISLPKTFVAAAVMGCSRRTWLPAGSPSTLIVSVPVRKLFSEMVGRS